MVYPRCGLEHWAAVLLVMPMTLVIVWTTLEGDCDGHGMMWQADKCLPGVYTRETIAPDAEVGRLTGTASKDAGTDVCGEAEEIDGFDNWHR